MACGLAALVLIAYLPMWQAGFLWDDDMLITDNVNVRGGLAGLLHIWTGQTFDYYPLTWSLFWIEWHLWGTNAVPYHLVNLLLHVIGTLLVWRVLMRLEVRAAWLGAALFAVSPVNVASVAWINQGKNTLSLVFCAGSVLAFLHAMDDNRRAYGLSIVLFIAALLSKTSVVPMVAVLPMIMWWKRCSRERYRMLVPFAIAALVAAIASVWFQQHNVLYTDVVRSEGALSRLAAAGMALWFYLGTQLFPFDLPIVYPRWNVSGLNFFEWIPLLGAIAILAVLYARRDALGRGPITAAVCYVVLLAPVLGAFNIYFMRFSLVADHWQYLASIVVLAAVAAAASRLPSRAFHPFAAIVVVVSVIFTWRQASLYTSSETLWRAAIDRNPNAWVGWHYLGQEAQGRGDIDNAIKDYREAARLQPDYAPAHNNLGVILYSQGKIDEAIPHFQAALDSRPDYAAAHDNLGLALQAQGRLVEAIEHYKAALALSPDWVNCRGHLAQAYIVARKYSDAKRELEAAMFNRPDEGALIFLLGLTLEKQGDYKAAVTRYEEALLLQNLEPWRAQTRLAWMRATAPDKTIRNGQKALQLATRACDETANQNVDALDALAAAYAECGQFKQAVDTAERAIRLASPQQRAGIEKRMKLYNAMLPYRESIDRQR